MDTLKQTVQRVMKGYAKNPVNGRSYLTVDETQTVFTVVTVAQFQGKRFTNTDLVVQLVNDKIVIERDQNDKLLVDALVQAKIPREQIILVYAGEVVPEPHPAA